jgi:hypothetical protein
VNDLLYQFAGFAEFVWIDSSCVWNWVLLLQVDVRK